MNFNFRRKNVTTAWQGTAAGFFLIVTASVGLAEEKPTENLWKTIRHARRRNGIADAFSTRLSPIAVFVFKTEKSAKAM